MKLLFLDLETTGTNAHEDDILEVGLIPVELNFETQQIVLGEPFTRAVGGDLRKVSNAYVLNMHTRSGLLREAREARGRLLTPTERLRDLDEEICTFLAETQGYQRWRIAGFSPHFDLEFIEAQLPLLASVFQHRTFDCSTLRDLWKELDPEGALFKTEASHRSLEDCEEAIECLRQWLGEWGKAGEWVVLRYVDYEKGAPTEDALPPEYPVHEKVLAVREQSQAIGEFLEWLGAEKGLHVAQWMTEHEMQPASYSAEKLLAEFFDIDLDKLEAEKRAILEAQRAANEAGG